VQEFLFNGIVNERRLVKKPIKISKETVSMPKKFLVIDDDPQFGKFVTKGLEKAGYTVEFMTSGTNAIRDILELAPDIVLTDIVMPDSEGIEIIIAIREKGYTNPIVAMSGFSNQSCSYLEAAKLLGANATLTKPFTMEEIQNLTNELLAS
jgi:CheY-like chemotaxis protein